MAGYIIQDSTLQGIADAIRSKTGDTAPIQTDAFANAISMIETGGGGGGGGGEVYTIEMQSDKTHNGDYNTAVSNFLNGVPVIVKSALQTYIAFTHEPKYGILYMCAMVSKQDSDPKLVCVSLRSNNKIEVPTRVLTPQWPPATVTRSASDIVKGKQIYDYTSGTLITGTHECSEATSLEDDA